MDHDMGLFSLLLSDSFTLLNVKLNDKQLIKKKTNEKQIVSNIKLQQSRKQPSSGLSFFTKGTTYLKRSYMTTHYLPSCFGLWAHF
jgi:hypothetical protein